MDGSDLANHYQLLEELGSGSFGIVYKAIEKATGEIVAIKHIDLETSEEDIQEIQGEINVLRTCASPFVTQYKTSFLRGYKLWIVMEFLGGGSCQDLLKPGPFNESHIAIICRELLLGLDYLHREGKIHRDIKAANVLLAQSGKVKLADFGVAAQLSNIKSMRNTFVGTPFWMAPEVIQESGHDSRADIWSLGITAIEMLHCEPPHAAIHPMKVLFLIPKSPAPRLEGPHYSRDLKDFVASCLIKDPEQRPTAKELLQHRFIRSAGKVEGLQELIFRRQMFDADQGKQAHPRFYEETLRQAPSAEEDDDWVFDTVKAPTINVDMATQRRKASSRRKPSKSVLQAPEQMIANLSLEDTPQEIQEQAMNDQNPPSTVRRATTKRRASPSQYASPEKRKASAQRVANIQRKPLAPDSNFGNGGSSVRQFRRVSDNSPTISPDGTVARTDENRPPFNETVTKEALLARRAYSKAIDPVFQEVFAQTGSNEKREAISRAAQALNALDLDDPEGEYWLLKGIIEKISNDPKLSSLLPTSQPATPQKPKLLLAQNNPHLKSHRRRQSSVLSTRNASLDEKQMNMPGQAVAGMEHTKQLADALYGKWVDGLKTRWPVIS
ncbi:MAG: hypothetical protein LQ340_003974 [Diploschistes diacapsis]|nr:MAG: hypothetical protein LQ340_003974 [Diploschistes diacapsis]